MTGTAIEKPTTGSGLTLADDQTWWNERQQKALEQLGVAGASQGDLLVFMHVAQRTGLDPFARQLYMICRKQRELVNGEWRDVVKQTIQTGIDGFRLVARRAADRLGETLAYEDTLWADSEGNWYELWTHSVAPTAAKVTVVRNGNRFSAVAMYREYVQTKRDGEPNAMWSRMPANQLAKCAEALALRKAFPQDLSGIYADEEMGQADRPAAAAATGGGASGSGRERMSRVLQPPPEDVVDGEVVGDPPADEALVESPRLDMRSQLAKRMFAGLGQLGVPDEEQHGWLSGRLGRSIESRKDLTEADASRVIDLVEADLVTRDEPPSGEA